MGRSRNCREFHKAIKSNVVVIVYQLLPPSQCRLIFQQNQLCFKSVVPSSPIKLFCMLGESYLFGFSH